MSRLHTPLPILGSILDLLVFLVAFTAAQLAFLFLPPLLGIPLGLLALLGILHLYLLRPPFAVPGTLPRTGPIGAGAGSLTLLVVAFLAAVWGISELYLHLVPVPEAQLNPFAPFLQTPEGRLAVTLLAVGAAPFVEELFFRGLIQRRLGLRFGPAVGIGVAAGVFALIHWLPWVFPLHFLLGLGFGVAVYVTGSVWTGVLLHAANNVMAMVGLTMVDGPAAAPPTADAGATGLPWVAAIAALLGTGLFIVLLRTMRRDEA